MRHCAIVSASIEDASGGGDGAYDLLDVTGSPAQIAKAIKDCLKYADMCRGPDWTYIGDGDAELYLNVRIKFGRHYVTPEEEP